MSHTVPLLAVVWLFSLAATAVADESIWNFSANSFISESPNSANVHQVEDFRKAKLRALRIIQAGDFSKAEAEASYFALTRFAYTEIVLRRNLLEMQSSAARVEYRKEFKTNIRITAAKLTEESGPEAARKFRKNLGSVGKAEKVAAL